MELTDFIFKHRNEILNLFLEHLQIVVLSVGISVFTGVAIGLYITRHRRLAQTVLYLAGIVMTIPSVAMFGLLMPIFSLIHQGIGLVPAVVALVLYAQLPIIRNTYTSIKNVDASTIEAARGMGMSRAQILKKIELPLSVPVIMAGIRISVVINIGIAAIAAYIGAGGLGKYIFRGIATTYKPMILTGAIFISFMAVAADLLFKKIEKLLTPQGLRQ